MELHLIPGHFSEATAKLLTELARPDARRFRIVGEDAKRHAAELAGLAEASRGASSVVSTHARVMGSRPLATRIEGFGAHPEGRVLVGVHLELIEECGVTLTDLEIGLLGVTCAALAGEEQGAVIIGIGLGPVGAGLPRGAVAEQIHALVKLHEDSVGVVVATAATAEKIGQLDGFVRASLADLVEWRRM
ncbi:MAG: hypothetical protein CMJ83_09215 [Planctomycetes bacterium]|nr:hypothetical protein [Planctomycetota bacterium]